MSNDLVRLACEQACDDKGFFDCHQFSIAFMRISGATDIGDSLDHRIVRTILAGRGDVLIVNCQRAKFQLLGEKPSYTDGHVGSRIKGVRKAMEPETGVPSAPNLIWIVINGTKHEFASDDERLSTKLLSYEDIRQLARFPEDSLPAVTVNIGKGWAMNPGNQIVCRGGEVFHATLSTPGVRRELWNPPTLIVTINGKQIEFAVDKSGKKCLSYCEIIKIAGFNSAQDVRYARKQGSLTDLLAQDESICCNGGEIIEVGNYKRPTA